MKVSSSLHVLVAGFAAIAFLLMAPLATYGQATASSSDLRATVEAALLSDPRSNDMTSAQFQAMVDALTKQTQRQGMTAQNIGWRPQAQPGAAEAACGSLPSFFCNLSTAFGFAGGNPLIPIALGASAMGLLFVIGMFLHRRGHHVRGSLRALQEKVFS